ncbi:MAG: hydrolase, partial [Actinobacteria bacterium]|nr:hydrolase [Actinomycetota bacterium]
SSEVGHVPIVTITDLCNAPEEYDGVLVEITGEAVGDILNGDDSGHKWVNLSSEGSTIGVYVSNEEADKVTNLGAYNVTGTVLEIQGTYHVACQDGHDGELDVHAAAVTVKSAGGVGEPDSIDPLFLVLGRASVVLGISLHVLHVQLKRRRG